METPGDRSDDGNVAA